jgi:hypothetical protein
MNYLKKNLGNSRLPADIMRLIYEYADPLIAIRKQIETHDYDLDEIMYQRMKKIMLKNYIDDTRVQEYMMIHNDEIIFFNLNNINDINFKYAILNYQSGYKNMFLWRHKRNQSICGLHSCYTDIEGRKYKMLSDLQDAKIYKYRNTRGNEYKMKNIYKKWLKL